MPKQIIYICFKSLKQVLQVTEFRIFRRLVFLLCTSVIIDGFALLLMLPVLNFLTSHENIRLHRIWGRIFRQLEFQEQEHFILAMVFLVFITFLIKNLYSISITSRMATFAHQTAKRIATTRFTYFFKKDHQFFTSTDKAQLVTEIIFIPSSYISGILLPMSILISEGLLLSCMVLAIAVFKPFLSLLLFFLLVPVMFFIYKSLKKKMYDMGQRRNQAATASYNIIHEALHAERELRQHQKAEWMSERLAKELNQVTQNDAGIYTYSSIPPRLIELAAIASIGIILFSGIIMGNGDQKTLYLISIFGAAAFRMIPSLNRITASLLKIKNYQYTIEKLIDSTDSATISDSAVPIISPSEIIEFSNFKFSHEHAGTDILSGGGLRLQKGYITGLSGPSGAGKTTLIHLLSGQFTQGNVTLTVGSQTIQSADILNSISAIASQDPVILNESLYTNITLASRQENQNCQDLLYDEICNICHLESLSGEIKLRSDLSAGEEGSRISGGQKQRIGLARALYKKPQILYLDEATSWLDSETEGKVIESLTKYIREKQIALCWITHQNHHHTHFKFKYLLSNKTISPF